MRRIRKNDLRVELAARKAQQQIQPEEGRQGEGELGLLTMHDESLDQRRTHCQTGAASTGRPALQLLRSSRTGSEAPRYMNISSGL